MRRRSYIYSPNPLPAKKRAKPRVLITTIIGICLITQTSWGAPVAINRTLEEAWLAAYRTNPTLASERAKLRATDEQVSQALSNWRPNVDVISSVGRLYQTLPNQGSSTTGDFAGTPRGYGIQVKQPLFRGFRTAAQTSAAEKLVLAERARLDAAEQQLFLDTATVFLDLVRDIALVDATRKDEAGLRKKLEEVQVRYRAGDLTQTDVHQAQTRLARANRNRVQAQNAIRLDIPRYRRLTGSEAPDNPVEPQLTLDDPTDLEDALTQAVAQNPNVIAALYQAEEANAEVRLAKGALLPELDLAFSATRNWEQSSTFPERNDNVQVLLQMNVPIYRAGTDYSRIRQAVEVVAERDDDLDEARRKAQDVAESAWQVMASAQESFDFAKAELRSATLALEGVREESRVGTRTTIDVLNAEQELLDAQTELVKSKHDIDLGMLQIKAAVGQLTANTLHLPTANYDPRQHYDEVRDKWFGTSAARAQDAVIPALIKKP